MDNTEDLKKFIRDSVLQWNIADTSAENLQSMVMTPESKCEDLIRTLESGLIKTGLSTLP